MLSKFSFIFCLIRFLYAAWDCSARVRTYPLFLEEKLECFRILRYHIEVERLTKPSLTKTQVSMCALPFNFIHTLIFPCYFYYYFYYFFNFILPLLENIIQILKESFKIYCALNDGIINLVDVVMSISV